MRVLLGLMVTIMATTASAGTLLDQDFRRLASDERVNLGEEYSGKVILVVNTASIAGLSLPTVVVQEGGYPCPELGDNLRSFLDGFDEAHGA